MGAHGRARPWVLGIWVGLSGPISETQAQTPQLMKLATLREKESSGNPTVGGHVKLPHPDVGHPSIVLCSASNAERRASSLSVAEAGS
ncbi:hypothetical protein F5B17DRAFT_25523 [Nemania serpens]|nr:hypothetical protein F5B17DRAFT_25523 [Nemania serpens]